MNTEKQRIAIAEACGWTFIEHLAFTGIPKGSRGNADAQVIPDYPNDLNAMHEAERVMVNDQTGDFDKWLSRIALNCNESCVHVSNYSWHATAAQRAEAFLRTLGLWEK